MNFSILKGNIVDVKVDAIVLPANTHLKEGSGASAAIFEAAGRKKLTKACAEQKHCDLGSATATLAYDLPEKYIIHAVVPKWIDGKHNEYSLLSTTYASALELADVMECKSMAFPLLASGNNKFDKDLAFDIAVESFQRFQPKNLETIQLIIYGNHISELVKSKGFSVSVLPVNLDKEKKRMERNKEAEKVINDAADVARKLVLENLQKGIDYMKVPEHREKLMEDGIHIFKLFLGNRKSITFIDKNMQ